MFIQARRIKMIIAVDFDYLRNSFASSDHRIFQFILSRLRLQSPPTRFSAISQLRMRRVRGNSVKGT